MAPYRHTTFLSCAAVLVWTIYYLQTSAFLSQPSRLHHYEVHSHSDAEIDSMLAADATATGNAQLKHHDSASANRYDISSRKKRPKGGEASLDDYEETEDLLDAKDYRRMWQYPPQWTDLNTANTKESQRAEDGIDTAEKAVPGSHSSYKSKTSKLYSATFPKQIWQYSSASESTANNDRIRKWDNTNKGLEHSWMSEEDADFFVHETFLVSRKSLVSAWDELASGYKISATLSMVRSNLLRYLLLLIYGGIYADIDTIPLIHADHYIPRHLADNYIDAIIGLEYEGTNSVGFLTSTMVSKAYHPIFLQAVERVISNLEYLKHSQGVSSFAQLKLSKAEVDAASGPIMFTDVVLHVIQDQNPKKNIDWKYFKSQTEPILLGDVLVLPVGAFNARHKLDPYGGEMTGFQGTRLVMQAEEIEKMSILESKELNRTQEGLQKEIPEDITYTGSKSMSTIQSTAITSQSIPTKSVSSVEATATDSTKIQVDPDLEDDSDDSQSFDVMDAGTKT